MPNSSAPSKSFVTKEMTERMKTSFGPSPDLDSIAILSMVSNMAAAVILAGTWTSRYFQDLNAKERCLNFKRSTSDALTNATQWQTSTTLTYHSRRVARNMLFSWQLSSS